MLLICDETTSHAGRIAWLVKPDKPTHDANASMCGLFVGLIARGCWGVRPSCDTIRHRVKKQSIKTCLSAQQVLFSHFPPLLDPASKPLLHYIPGTNVCGFFLVSAFTGIAVGVSARFHYVTLFLVTRQLTPPRAVGISPVIR